MIYQDLTIMTVNAPNKKVVLHKTKDDRIKGKTENSTVIAEELITLSQ